MTDDQQYYGYIALQETNYKPLLDYEIISNVEDYSRLIDIYHAYCKYKGFASVMPIFPGEFSDPRVEFVTYKDQGEVVAFTMIRKLDPIAVDNMQFAWNYANPKLKIGYKSIRTECAIYRDLGYEQMLIDYDMYYKSQLQGYKLYGSLE